MDKVYGAHGATLQAAHLTGNQARTETSLEKVISRLGTIVNRIDSCSVRANTIANAVLGYQGEEATNGLKPAQVATSVSDYLEEIDTALMRLDQHLNRLTH